MWVHKKTQAIARVYLVQIDLWQSSRPSLSLLLAVFSPALANFEARVALANDVNSPAAFYDLAVGMSELQRTDGGNYFYDEPFQ